MNDSSGAPPYGLRGESSDTSLVVGAHAAHLAGSSLAAGFPCATCHLVPAFVWDSAHYDSFVPGQNVITDTVAELTWSGLAGNESSWNRTTRRCSNTYCHGNFIGGYHANAPVWTGAVQASCGSCHDVGPNPDSLRWIHPSHVGDFGLRCADCHAAVVDTLLAITTPAQHVNGHADMQVRDSTLCKTCHEPGADLCVRCHGGIDNQTGAPPRGLRGETATSQTAVGAHTKHVDGGILGGPYDCIACHIKPSTVADFGHYGTDSTAEITWGGFSDGGNASWNHATATCAGTYCHGDFAGGYPANTPVWTGVDQARCGSCHNFGHNPSDLGWKHGFHVGSLGLICNECHASVVDNDMAIISTTLHVNGEKEVQIRDSSVCAVCHEPGADLCVRCHGGTDNQTGAPPRGLRGETARTTLAVGAHTSHISGGTFADGFDCVECHNKPQTVSDSGHYALDSLAEITWGGISGGSSVWNRSSATCAATYCHGNFPGGKTATATWTSLSGVACNSCHDDGANPSSLLGRHQLHANENVACYRCHALTVDSQNNIIGQGVHVDGVRTVRFSPNTGNYSTGSCTDPAGCHGDEDWY